MKEIAEGSSHLRLANLRTWICWIPGLTVSLTNTVVEKVQEYSFSSFKNKALSVVTILAEDIEVFWCVKKGQLTLASWV